MSYTGSDALQYRTALVDAVEQLDDATTRVRAASIDELSHEMDDLEAKVEEVSAAIPCESGVMEFISDLENTPGDDMYHYEDVALTYDQLSGSWRDNDHIESNLHLVHFAALAATLIELLDDTKIRNTRMALQGMVLQLQSGGFYSSHDAAIFIEEYGEWLGEAV